MTTKDEMTPTADPARATASPMAFASYVDNNYLPGFEVLVKSLLLTNPWMEQDYIVYYDDLSATSIARISVLYPRFVFRRVDTSVYAGYVKPDNANNYLVDKAYYILEAFRERGYRRIVTLDVDMVVLGDVRHLFETEASFSAVPQLFENQGGRRINSGVMTFDRSCMNDEFVARMDAIGRSGAYDLARHDQGVLSAVFDGEYVRLDNKYNLVKRAIERGGAAPDDTRILHFTGAAKPWNGGEVGYSHLEQIWEECNLPVALFWRRAAGALPDGPVRAFYADLAQRLSGLTDEQVGDLPGTAAAHFAEGDFERAVAVYELELLATPAPGPTFWLGYGRALHAVSRPDGAAAALTLGQLSSDTAPRALAVLADLHWTGHDYDAAETAVVEALRREPTTRRTRLVLARIAASRRTDRLIPAGSGPAIGHVAFYTDPEGNFGDVMLPLAVRASIGSAVPDARWSSIHAHQVFGLEEATWANEHLDAIVIGGGGLFLPDTAPNGNSGWQWNVTDEALHALTIPIIVYTVGYNLFEGQRFHGDRFQNSVSTLIEKAEYVGLRNRGSVRNVSAVVGERLAAKVEYLPCVTTVYGPLTDRDPAPVPPVAAQRPIVYLNVAFDRHDLRFGDGYATFVGQIARFVRSVSDRVDVVCLAHRESDERIKRDLHVQEGVRIGTEALQRRQPDEALELIERAAVVVGMRGHAGMIPFGVGTPIVSVISHPKLRYFLDDINHPEWGVVSSDPELGSRLTDLVLAIVDDQPRYRQEILAARAVLEDVVTSANARIAKIIAG